MLRGGELKIVFFIQLKCRVMHYEKTGSGNEGLTFSPAAQAGRSNPVTIQRKLSVGAVNERQEHEADAMADHVMRMPEPNLIQRKCAHCEEEEAQRKPLTSFIQKKEEGGKSTVSDAVHHQVQATKGGGNALPHSTKTFMESRFGTDFSGVRIHSGGYASQMSAELNAQAFTVGNDIYFNSGKFSPESSAGKHLLAHELTHTLQQRKEISLQRSCSDGKCDKCAGGTKDFWVTAYFRREITEAATKTLNKQIAEAKTILANCCLNLKVEINKDRVAGSSTMNAYTPATAKDRWRFTADETALGTGKTFDAAKGIPMLVVDDVPLSGGGVTVGKVFDDKYTGRNYFILGLNQSTTPNANCNHIAHELWHIGGVDKHDPANGPITACTGNGVSDKYCNNLRVLV